MLIPDMFCNRGDIKRDFWHLFDLCNVKCVDGEDSLIKVRAAEMLMRLLLLLKDTFYFSVDCTVDFFLTSSF